MKHNGKWNFINGSDLDYCDACVLCKNLGKWSSNWACVVFDVCVSLCEYVFGKFSM